MSSYDGLTGTPGEVDVALGNWLSVSRDGRPNSINECYTENDEFDSYKYSRYLDKLAELDELGDELFDLEDDDDDAMDDSTTTTTASKRRNRKVKSRCPYYWRNGAKVYYTPTMTYWYLRYVNNPPFEDPTFHPQFRTRFRMPYDEFQVLVAKCKANQMFRRWLGRDATKREASPIELLLLASLRYLGRGLTFDDLFSIDSIERRLASFVCKSRRAS